MEWTCDFTFKILGLDSKGYLFLLYFPILVKMSRSFKIHFFFQFLHHCLCFSSLLHTNFILEVLHQMHPLGPHLVSFFWLKKFIVFFFGKVFIFSISIFFLQVVKNGAHSWTIKSFTTAGINQNLRVLFKLLILFRRFFSFYIIFEFLHFLQFIIFLEENHLWKGFCFHLLGSV